MTKTTLFVGDTHLQFGLIESFIKETVKSENVEQIVFVGDYLDQWNCDMNGQLYINELKLLLDFKTDMNNKGIDVIFLVGNHDVPYLTQQYEYYSCKQANCLNKIYNLLTALQPQIAFKVTDNLIASHAGYIDDFDMKDDHFKPWSFDLIDEYLYLQNKVGQSRGGIYVYGGVLWIDLQDLLKIDTNFKQIVGHTPVQKIDVTNKTIGIDTFSLTSSYQPIGDGSLLIYKDEHFKVIKNKDWQTPELELKRFLYFEDN